MSRRCSMVLMAKILLLIMLSAHVAHAVHVRCNRPIVVAVVDTGFGYHGAGKGAKLCKYGHKDFTSINEFAPNVYGTVDPVPLDTVGHGTNVVGIIEDNIGHNKNYCIEIIKYWSHSGNVTNTIKSFEYAADIQADYVNYSSGGDTSSTAELAVVERLLDQGATMVVAAGNNESELSSVNKYYPAMYDKRIVVVGSLISPGHKAPSSNYGSPVNRWEIGFRVSGYGIVQSGTSQAAATATGKIVSKSSNKCDIGE